MRVPLSFSIPCGICTQCGREIVDGEKAAVVVRAGKAWGDGKSAVIPVEDGAELFTASVLCPDCQGSAVSSVPATEETPVVPATTEEPK